MKACNYFLGLHNVIQAKICTLQSPGFSWSVHTFNYSFQLKVLLISSLTSLEWWGQISNQSIIWYTHYGIACHYTQIECNVKTCRANQLADWFNTPWQMFIRSYKDVSQLCLSFISVLNIFYIISKLGTSVNYRKEC